jgi:Flp pilus assembly protein TadG
MKKHLRNYPGVLTVEATVIFPIYMMVILTIVSLMNIFYTHAVIQQALNVTALRIAEYSYALKATNTLESFEWGAEASQQVSALKQNINNVSGAAERTLGGFANGFTLENIAEVINNATEFAGSLDTLIKQLQGLNKETLGRYAIGIFVDSGSDTIVNGLVKKYLTDMQLDMRNVSNLDFSASEYYYGANKDVTLLVTYEYHNPLGIKFFDRANMMNTCTVHPWIGSGS